MGYTSTVLPAVSSKRVKAALVVPEGMQDLDLEDCDGLTGKG